MHKDFRGERQGVEASSNKTSEIVRTGQGSTAGKKTAQNVSPWGVDRKGKKSDALEVTLGTAGT